MIDLYITIAVLVISLTAFSGIFFLSLKEEKLKKIIPFLISFSTGAFLGGVFIHLLPKLFSASKSPEEFSKLSALILTGILFFYLIEKFIHWHHHHSPEESQDCEVCQKKKIKPIGYTILFSDGMHNFMDGILIASSFMLDVNLGITATIMVLLHEIPQEIGDFGVLLHAGFSKTKALLFNFLSGLTALLGAWLTILFLNLADFKIELTALAGGSFLYIALVDLIPELHKHKHTKKTILIEFAFVLLGISFMFLVKFLKHN